MIELFAVVCGVLHSKGGNIAQAQTEATDSCWFVGACGEKMYTGN